MKSKRIIIILLLLFGIAAVSIGIFASTMEPEEIVVNNVDLDEIADGIYEGEASNELLKAVVSVEVKDSQIISIEIQEHDTMLGKSAEKITEDIIEKQMVDVDAITSATYSSQTIKKAVEEALKKGRSKL